MYMYIDLALTFRDGIVDILYTYTYFVFVFVKKKKLKKT